MGHWTMACRDSREAGRPGPRSRRLSRRAAGAGPAVPARPAIKTLSTTGSRLPTLADARRRAPNLAWMSYLNRPCGMTGVTLVDASRELLYTGGKHVSA